MKTLFAITFAFAATMSTGAFAHHGGPHHGGGFGGGHGGHGNRQIVCRVKNLRGMNFQARGNAFNRFMVERRAMDKCYRAGSRVCIATGCSKF